VERNVALGEVVRTSQPQTLFVVADLHKLQLELNVKPEDISQVHVGRPVTFRPDDGGDGISGVVSHISPKVDSQTRQVRVHAEISDPDGRLRPNSFGTGHILVGERTSEL
jgi:cobalt-zinc-cadmium efflux system membrane fusion protein